MTRVLYPGSFDPITNGHLNLIERGVTVFGRLTVAVAQNVRKTALFTADERVAMIREALRESAGLGPDKVDVTTFEGLLVDYARKSGANVILRGLRALSDFEFEFQMTHMNRRLAPDIETIFMMTGEEHFYVASSLVREIAVFGGNLSGLVPTNVERLLEEKFKRR